MDYDKGYRIGLVRSSTSECIVNRLVLSAHWRVILRVTRVTIQIESSVRFCDLTSGDEENSGRILKISYQSLTVRLPVGVGGRSPFSSITADWMHASILFCAILTIASTYGLFFLSEIINSIELAQSLFSSPLDSVIQWKTFLRLDPLASYFLDLVQKFIVIFIGIYLLETFPSHPLMGGQNKMFCGPIEPSHDILVVIIHFRARSLHDESRAGPIISI